jgi:rhodanese-related sulfurtransferase
MTALIPIDAATLAQRLKRGEIKLIDIREPMEFAREHIAEAASIPLSGLAAGRLKIHSDMPVAFTCKTGMRTGANCDSLAAHVGEPAYVLQGGLEGWKKAGLAVVANRKAPAQTMRQVQVTAGSLVVLGAVLAITVDPTFIWLSAIVGAGLAFAGITGLTNLLAPAPENPRKG